MDYVRDHSMMVVFFGFFSMVWYGWAQENPPAEWRKYIGIATAVSTLLLLLGIYLSIKNWDKATALANPSSMTNYFIFLILEFLIAGIGVFLLFRMGLKEYAAPWVCFIVGVHFFGLKFVFDDFSLHILGLLLVIISISSLFVAKKYGVANSLVTGVTAGTTLNLFVLYNLFRLFF